MNLEILNEYHKNGLLYKQTHPILPLTIWNYSPDVQYGRKWDAVTLQCRGLVTDDKGNVVARPFKKFFNIEEQMHTSTKEFDVYEKMDGSLGILFYYNGDWVYATRGSFTSDQSIRFKEIMEDRYYSALFSSLSHSNTYLFEIIYPENRIVVDYGDEERLVLLGEINPITGEEFNVQPYRAFGLDVVPMYNDIEDYSKLKQMVQNNAEGFVVKFSNGERMKVKGEEYVRLHKIMTQISSTAVWEVLSNGGEMSDYLTDVPDEFYDKIREYEELTLDEYWSVSNLADTYFREFYVDGLDAKTFAQHISWMLNIYKSLLWAQYNMKMSNYSNIIWKYIKPDYKPL